MKIFLLLPAFISFAIGVDYDCTAQNINLIGHDLSLENGGQGIKVPSESACEAECKKRSKCNYWTFISAWELNCYLKSRLGEKVDFDGAVSGASGFALCGLLETPAILIKKSQTECPMEDTTFRGGDLISDGFETDFYWDCSQRCIDSPRCTHWTFVSKWKINCYLRSGKVQRMPLEGHLSGTYGSGCDADTLTRKLCYKENELSNSILVDKTCLLGTANAFGLTDVYVEQKFNGTEWIISESEALCGYTDTDGELPTSCAAVANRVRTRSPTAGYTRALAKPPASNRCAFYNRNWKRIRGKLFCVRG